MDESLLRLLKRIAALIADVFPFTDLEWDTDDPEDFCGDIGKFYYIEVSPVLEEDVNGHVIDVFFSERGESTPIATYQLPGNPNWEKFESWLMEKAYREVIMEAAKMLDACGIDFPLPPLAVKHGVDSKPAYVRPSGRATHLIEMSDIFWTGSALIGGPAGGGKTSVALHIASAALDKGPVHIINNDMEPEDFLNNYASRFPHRLEDGKTLSVRGFDTEAKPDELFDSLVSWIKGLDGAKLIVIDDTTIIKKIRDRLPELTRRAGAKILGVEQVARRTDTPAKWSKKLGDDLDTLGAAFWVEWGERKDLGQLYVLKHHAENGPRLLPVTIKR